MPKKSGLGKGLESLMGEANYEVGATNDVAMLEISKIKPNPDQPRKNFDEDALSELSDSIAKNGVLQPILVRKKGSKYEIVAGERRYQAAKMAGVKEVPVVIKDVADEDVFKLALIENLQRSDLDPIEEARGFRQLLDEQNLTQEQLGEALSKSRSAITNSLRLLDLPEVVQDMMADGKLTAGHARAILAVPGEEARTKLAYKVVDEHLSVRQTENLAPLFSMGDVPRAPRAAMPKSYKRAARQLRMALDTGVKVRSVRGKSKIEIEFRDEDDLVRILDLMAIDH